MSWELPAKNVMCQIMSNLWCFHAFKDMFGLPIIFTDEDRQSVEQSWWITILVLIRYLGYAWITKYHKVVSCLSLKRFSCHPLLSPCLPQLLNDTILVRILSLPSDPLVLSRVPRARGSWMGRLECTPGRSGNRLGHGGLARRFWLAPFTCFLKLLFSSLSILNTSKNQYEPVLHQPHASIWSNIQCICN